MSVKFRLAAAAVIAAGSFAITGCSDKDSVHAENESLESVAAKVADSNVKPLPGQWQSTMKIEKLDIPNLPAEAKAAMQQQMGAAQSFSSCLTPEQAAKPSAEFFQGKQSGCTYEKFAMEGGKIDAVMTCANGGQNQKMTMTGVYGAEAYDIRISADGEMQPGMPMSMTMAISSKRTGECTGKEQG